MNKWIVSAILFSVAGISVPALSNQPVNTNKTPTRQSFSWAKFSEIIFSKKPPIKPRTGGSRPTQVSCMISPEKSDVTTIVWSERPLFIWQGSVQKIAVRPEGSEQDLWSQPVTGRQSINYTGKALQPGQTYEWIVNSSMFVPFQVMEAQQRDRITSELKTLENQLKAKGVDTEAIALAKANYFAENQLWSDALQQAYSVQKPSPELDRIRKDIPNQLCNARPLVRNNSTSP
ncbi:hypothetical protein [Scytonema sp. PRP1]|uniref:hypothetical protein n=1 Tax=Scytonema sp. PRP1 TaxID=3120513 RepID=UPI00300C4BF5